MNFNFFKKLWQKAPPELRGVIRQTLRQRAADALEKAKTKALKKLKDKTKTR